MSTLPSGTVTFLFTDIEDSTHLWQEQPEAMALAHAQHDEILHAAIAANNGYVFQIIGDSFNAAFHNAHDAFMAALTAQRGLKEAFDGASLAVKARMGINTGSAQIQADGRYNGYVTIASAQRVMSVAYGGQVLLSQTTRDLLQSLPDGVSLADLGEHQLRSLRAPLRLYQLIAPDLPKEFPPIQSLSAHPNNLPAQLTSFVGREKQLNEITRLLANNRMLTLIGPGGTGKTRGSPCNWPKPSFPTSKMESGLSNSLPSQMPHTLFQQQPLSLIYTKYRACPCSMFSSIICAANNFCSCLTIVSIL